ncbi:MAG: glycosyltransferase family 2 protein [Verrucomicrobia bacterium]|nr:glycosyltransferase family 2 protein [Verrucomicrobiota bacterium]
MKLSVVILNWNGKKDTLACLDSLQKTQAPPFSIIVVDNGSQDDSVAAISQEFPSATLLQTGKNLGYAGGNNVGIAHALKQGADLVLLLNNDTLVDRHFIAAYLHQASEEKKAGILGAYPLRMTHPDKLDHLGGKWNTETATFDLVGLEAPQGFRTDEPLDYVCGCSILIRREVFEAIGMLEPTFFLFWEEADFCMRAKKAGFGIDICYEAMLLHKVSASFVGGTPHKTYFWWRGRCLWIERNCSPEEKQRLYRKIILPQQRHLLKLRLLKNMHLFLESLLSNKDVSQKKAKLLQYRAALEGYRDFRKACFGSGPSWLFNKRVNS